MVVEKAIDFCSFTQVTLEDIDYLLSIVDTPSIILKHREQVEALRRLRKFLFAEVEMEMQGAVRGNSHQSALSTPPRTDLPTNR